MEVKRNYMCTNALEHFFYQDILEFIFVVNYTHFIKKSHNLIRNFNKYKMFNGVLMLVCPYMSIYILDQK